MEKVGFTTGMISVIEKSTGISFEWFIVLLLLLTVELILRAIPTHNRSSFFYRFLKLLSTIVDFILPPDRHINKEKQE